MILDTLLSLDTSFSTEEIMDPLPEAGLTLLIAVGVNLVVFDFFFFLVLETGGVVFRPVSTMVLPLLILFPGEGILARSKSLPC